MSTTSKNAQNGSKASAASKNGKANETSNVVVPVAPAKPERTLEDRLQSVAEVKALTDKRAIFVERRSEIRQFSFGSDEHSAVLSINDQSGRTFQTRNGYLIKKLTDHLEYLITEKIVELDQEIMAFEI